MPDALLRYRNRGDTAANWALANPVLAESELGREKDTNRFKFGDGITAWSGLPYADSSAILSTPVIAGENLSGHRAIYIGSNDQARLADPSTSVENPPVGITLGAALIGGLVPIRTSGLATETSWNWLPGPIYLGANGTLTQIAPSSGAIVRMGTAAGPDRMRVDAQLIATV